MVTGARHPEAPASSTPERPHQASPPGEGHRPAGRGVPELLPPQPESVQSVSPKVTPATKSRRATSDGHISAHGGNIGSAAVGAETATCAVPLS